MTRAERAKNYFQSGYNCSQAVLLAFSDLLNVSEEVLQAVGKPMGGGFGRLRQTCGGVTGAAMVAGLLFPDMSKNDMYALVQEIAKRFAERNGSYQCGELLTGVGVKAETSPNAENRTPEYYKKRPCADLVFDAAEILDEILTERRSV